MTVDARLRVACDHRVHRELVEFDWFEDTDFRTLRFIQPFANNAVRIWFNGVEVLQNDPVYGWRLLKDEFSADADPKVKLVFNRPIHEHESLFEVSYTSPIRLCRKCLGLGVLYDHGYDKQGRIIEVVHEGKLLEHVTKMLLTEITSNPFFLWYGTNIPNQIYQAIRDPAYLEQQIQTEVSLALQKYKNIQFKQSRAQQLDLREILKDILSVVVQMDPDDPRIFYIYVSISTAAGDVIEVDEQLFASDQFASVPNREVGLI